MQVMHQRCAGLDVHKEMIVACVRLMVGAKVTRECRTFDTSTTGLLALLAWLTEAGCTHVAMEATGVSWKPVWNILSDGAFDLIVANAAHLKNVPGRKTDVNDAMWIADLVACGLIKASFVPEPAIQELRSLMRARKQLGREQASHVQRLQKTLDGLGHHRHRRGDRTADDHSAYRRRDHSTEAGRPGRSPHPIAAGPVGRGVAWAGDGPPSFLGEVVFGAI
jgi:transposase